MSALANYLSTFISDPLMVDVIMGVLVIVLASALLLALGIDLFLNKN